jgi:hypothetical protein
MVDQFLVGLGIHESVKELAIAKIHRKAQSCSYLSAEIISDEPTMAAVRSRSIDAVWMCSAFCAALVLAVSVLIVLGTGDRGIHAALAATARLQFLLFWPAYSGGALASLFGPAFQPLKRYAREFGVAFSSALLVHLGLVGLLCLMGAPPGTEVFIFFGIAAAWAYLLALFSIPRLHQALGPKYWRLLSFVGMNYLAYAFFVDFWNGEPLHGGIKHAVKYYPFVVLAVAGPSLRLAAFVRRLGSRLAATGRPHAEPQADSVGITE